MVSEVEGITFVLSTAKEDCIGNPLTNFDEFEECYTQVDFWHPTKPKPFEDSFYPIEADAFNFLLFDKNNIGFLEHWLVNNYGQKQYRFEDC